MNKILNNKYLYMDSKINISYINTCKGEIIVSDSNKTLITRATLRDNIFRNLKNFLPKFIDKNGYYNGTILAKTYVLIKDNPQIFKINSHICPITKETYKFIPKYIKPSNFYNTIMNGKLLDDCEYLDKIGAKIFYENTVDYIILPNFLEYPIDQNDIFEIDIHKYYFSLFLKNPNYTSIYSFTSKDIPFLESLQEIIYKFQSRFSKNENLIRYMTDITINTENKDNMIMISFNTFDKSINRKYTSNIDLYREYKLSELIDNLKTNNPIILNLRVNENNSNFDILCENKINNKIQIGGTLSPFSNIKPTDIINQYYYTTDEKEKGYCSVFLLMNIRGKDCIVSIKITTYEQLKYDCNYRKLYYKAILKQLNNIISKTYKTYLMYLPTRVKIRIVEQNAIPKIFRYYALETSEHYKNTILNKIKSAKIDATIILYLLLKRLEISNDENYSKLRLDLLDIDLLKNMIDCPFLFTNNFILTCRSNLAKDVFVIWYFPEIKLLNYDNLHNAIFKNKNLSYEQFRLNNEIQNAIIENTNFYEIYKQSNFIYNLRHLYSEQNIKEIDYLLNQLRLPNKIAYSHYPNSAYYNIYHLMVINYDKNIGDDMTRKDVLFRYLSNDRTMLYDHFKYLNYFDKNIMIETSGSSIESGYKYLEERLRSELKFYPI